MNASIRITAATLDQGTRALAQIEPAFGRIVIDHGPPPLWVRAPGFPTLVKLVLEQQVSLASAAAVYRRLRADIGAVTARRVLEAGPERLRAVGFTRQKAEYVHDMATAIASRRLRLGALAHMPHTEARAVLLALRGIGPWTADVYCLVALRAADVWPHGDVALADAAHHVLGLPARPAQDALTAMAAAWAPWRSVAARLLWHHYLSVRGRA
jgi:DNA-3-methyladenine glycosylase II